MTVVVCCLCAQGKRTVSDFDGIKKEVARVCGKNPKTAVREFHTFLTTVLKNM